ncbi:MAG: phosphatidate cytidylyltransferase [Chloroflexi bacterium]|nr:phosphatidate cytidylyltransferase [Chloroflexota bacterium]MBI3732019.1 phosphatidate cytidylyltransferase [Chloroflexota bacterium]
MILRRIISGAILIPLVSIPAYFGDWLYFILILGVAVLAAYEFDDLMRGGGYRPERLWGFVLIVLLLVDAARPHDQILRASLPLFVMLTLAYPLFAADLGGALVNWALTLAGALYIGGLLAQFLLLRELDNGLKLSALAAFATWTADTTAYFVGTRYGRHRFSPRISPKKSWEGALAGGAAGWLVGVLWASAALPGLTLVHGAVLSALVVVAGMIGDLAESLIKRQVSAKDSGGLIPGHGGVLDRIDSLLFAFPAALLYAVWVLR